MNKNFTILIVEDDTITASIIADAVAPLAKVVVANTSAMAETYAREHKPDLILLDIQLPDTNGIELCSKLKASSFAASSKVIFVTADQDHDTELNAFSQGADDYIKKPVNIATLIVRVRLQLNLLKQRRQLMQVNQLQSKIFATLPSYISCWDNHLKNVFNNDVNQAWFTHIKETKGFLLEALFTKSHCTSLKRHLVAMKLNKSESFELNKVIIRGQARTLSVSLISEKLVDGKIGFVMVLSDITQQKSELADLISDTRKYEAALKSIEEGVISTDTSTHITYMNRIAQQLTGHNLEEVIGKPIDEVMIIKNATDDSRLPHSIHYALQECASVSSLPEASISNTQGELIGIKELSSPILSANNEVIGAISVFHDVSHMQTYQSELERLTNHDALTGLPNRALLIDRAQQCLKRIIKDNSNAGLVIINIDRFRKINELHGYEIGDSLLKEVASFLSSFLQPSDTLARHTGDEFIILLSDNAKPEDVNSFCQNLLHAFNKKWSVGVLEFDLSITMGIAIAPNDATEPQALYRMADLAMHEAKRSSRNNFRFYSSEIEQTLAQYVVSINGLQQGLKNGEFVVYYQPKVDALTGEIKGVEALVRWQKSNGMILPPKEFIELAENSGLILELGEFVLNTACSEVCKWLADSPELSLAVNVSPLQFNSSFVNVVKNTLDKSGFPASQLEIEVTETLLISDDTALSTFNLLKQLDVKLALDDFGTGFSSLSYVKDFPFDILKIDQSFVIGMLDKDPSKAENKDMAIVKTIINLAKDLSLVPVAEGVETKRHADALKALDCSLLQGYHFSKPVTADLMHQLLLDSLKASMGPEAEQ